MSGNPDVFALLEEMLDSGRTPEEVCRDCPELLPEVAQCATLASWPSTTSAFTRGRSIIVSDYLDGPDLGRWLRDNRPTWPEAALLAAAVADALAHAHSRHIVHRDVKPANILLTVGPRTGPCGLRPGPRRVPGGRRARRHRLPAPRGTCRPSRPRARPIASTGVPTSTAWASCFTKCSPGASFPSEQSTGTAAAGA